MSRTNGDHSTVYVGGLLEIDSDSSGVTASRAHYLIDGLAVAVRDFDVGIETSFVLQDHRDSIVAAFNDDTATLGAFRYLPWGSLRSTVGSNPSDRGFTAQVSDATSAPSGGTGLLNYIARYFDPEVGVFTATDSVVPDPSNPSDLNRYAYVRANPIIFVDPSGHAPVGTLSVDGGVKSCGSQAMGNAQCGGWVGNWAVEHADEFAHGLADENLWDVARSEYALWDAENRDHGEFAETLGGFAIELTKGVAVAAVGIVSANVCITTVGAGCAVFGMAMAGGANVGADALTGDLDEPSDYLWSLGEGVLTGGLGIWRGKPLGTLPGRNPGSTGGTVTFLRLLSNPATRGAVSGAMGELAFRAASAGVAGTIVHAIARKAIER